MVDDDSDDLFLTRLGFRNSEFDVNFIGLQSADALYDHIQKKGILSIDVLLLDLNMPFISGLDILETLGDYQACLAKGADGYIAKPSNSAQTKDFISRVCEAGVTPKLAEKVETAR